MARGVSTDADPPPTGFVADRPRMFGGDLEPTRLPWRWAEQRLVVARNYWIVTVRSDGRPHARPVWGVWADDAFWFSTGSLADGNLRRRPDITVHLESGGESVILEGTAEEVVRRDVVVRIADLYNAKYDWDMDPGDLPSPFWQVRTTVAFGWASDDSGLDNGAAFHGTATRWRPQSA